jgi:lipoprotein-anchoring transpeptidase ErfK/SrfK
LKNRKLAKLVFAGAVIASSPAAFPASYARVQLTPELVNDAARNTLSGRKRSRAALLRAQVLLDRAHFSPGEIDAASGSSLRQALAGFQKNIGLRASGSLDQATWAALNRDRASILTPYTISDANVVGPFIPIPPDMLGKSRMHRLGYASAAEALGEKFHVSPALLQQLNPGKDLGRAGEDIVVPNVDASLPLPKAAKIIVTQSDATVTLLDAAGKTIAQYPATTGSAHDPLPFGRWKINGIARNPVYHYNPKLFWDAKAGDQKALIPPGPNNPVGVVWFDLSKQHYGIHGTPEPAKIGKTQSHGCIRLSNWNADELSHVVSAGVTVILQQ